MSFVPFAYRAWAKRLDWIAGQLISETAGVDGDSCWFFLDNGRHQYTACNCRLWGVNAYEINDIDPVKRQKAQEGKVWLKAQIEGKQVFVLSKGLDKYGRPLLIVWVDESDFGDNASSVNKALLDAGLAVAYMGELI
jgi:endonuclease YncB( thermonuclease family)